MQVQAAVVQIDGPHHGDPAIHQPGFCVQKARREGVDLDPGADQRLKVAAGQLVNHLFIRDAGGINAHIHAALCGQAQCRHGGVIQNQVRRGDPQRFLRLGDQVQVDIFGNILIIHRAVAVGLHKADRRLFRRERLLLAVSIQTGIVGALAGPQLQKDRGKAPRRGALQPHAGIAPIAKALFLVNVLIRQVKTAGKGGFSIHHHNLAVVAAVHHQVQQRHKRVKRHCLDPFHLQGLPVLGGQASGTAHIVINHPHIHALSRFTTQHIMYGIPHFALGDNKELQKDRFLC